jgi:hypothetical protein
VVEHFSEKERVGSSILPLGTKTNRPDLGRDGLFFRKERKDYFTVSFKALPARNFGTFMAATLTMAPVLGFLAWRAARCLTVKMPKPAMETSSPFFKLLVIESNTMSTISSAWTFVPPSFACTASAISDLFIDLLFLLNQPINSTCPAFGRAL